ncbi:hypothetical protein BKI52_03465 [marine bacterium AO1-C]|nr:hypothetical protein BKI52_03465 [marine bacterium AO1-C]
MKVIKQLVTHIAQQRYFLSVAFIGIIGLQAPLQAQYKIETTAGGAENIQAILTSIYSGGAHGIEIDASGNLYFSEDSRIRKIDASGKISTFAGIGGSSRSSGDGGPATSAQFWGVGDIVFDAVGNMYFTDFSHNRLRKIDATTGIVTTIAGTGASGFSGDHGPAVGAQLNSPKGLAIDTDGNIYIADENNRRIRKINTSGIITTIAGTGAFGDSGDGGQATSAQFKSVDDIAVHGSNLYIVDDNSDRVRKIDLSTGTISNFAGGGSTSANGIAATSARLNQPSGVATDASGNLYITESSGRLVRKVNAGTGIITTVAGNGSSGHTGDGGSATSASVDIPTGVAVDAAGNIYIKEELYIRKVDATTGNISTLTGNGNNGYAVAFTGDGGPANQAQFYQQIGVATDAAGNVYVADTYNHRVRKIDAATGNISTIAGNGTANSSGDGGQAVSAQINGPYGVATDAAGNIYIAEGFGHRVRKINTSGVITTIAGTGSAGYSGDGGSATSATLSTPQDMVIDATGNLYILDYSNRRIRKVSTSGTITTIVGTGVSGYSGDGGQASTAQITIPTGLAIDGSNNLYFTDVNNHRVRKINLNTGIISTVAGTGVSGYSGDGGPATSAQISSPGGIAVDAAGNIYFGDFSLAGVRKIDATTGNISTIAGKGIRGYSGDGGLGTSATFDYIRGMAVDASGNIYVSDFHASTVRKLTPASEINLKQSTTSIASGGSQVFGTTTFNTPKTISFTIENTGIGAMNISEVSISGGFSITNGLPLTNIAAGSNASITVAMDVSSVGAKTGTLTIKSNDPDEATYTVSLSGTVNKADQTITFGALSAKTFGDANFNLNATGGASGNAITYTSSNTSVATISGNTVTIVGAGNTTITASQTGNTNYNAATNVDQSLTVNKADQSITFGALSAKTFGDANFNLNATGGASGNTVTYTSSNTSVATISGNTVTIVGVGNTTITASQTGNTNYNVAPNVDQSLTVNKADQTITFGALSAKTFGDGDFNLNATGGASGSAITYTSSNTSVATISGNTVTIVGAGNTTITASQTGNTNYNAATDVDQSLTVNKADQRITFDLSSDAIKTVGGPDFNLTATGGSSGNTVTFTSSNTSVATISGNTVTIVGVGNTTITASQAGNTNYNAATDVTQQLTITNKTTQTINFSLGANATKTFGDAGFSLSASGGASGNAITYTSSNTSVATISGSTVTIVGAGTSTITANQAGNATYADAVPVNQTLTVNKANQNISFNLGGDASKVVGDANFTLNATGGASGNAIAYTSSNTAVATISGTTVTITGAGTTVITASQTGNTNYNAATDVTQTLTVTNKTAQTISFDLGTNATKTYGDASFDLNATGGGSGNKVTFTSSNTSVATISGNTVTIVGAGTATITATQAGTATYANATPVDQSLTVNKADQVISFDLGGDATKVIGDASFTLNATGGASGNAITYTSSNTAVATISGNTVTIVGQGNATVTANQAGNDNYNAATEVSQTLTVNDRITSLSNTLKVGQLKLYPNPVETAFVLSFSNNIVVPGSLNVQIFDAQGKLAQSIAGNLNNTNDMWINIAGLAAGNYQVIISFIGTDGQQQKIQRKIIKR